MCVIIVKEANVKEPDQKTLKECFDSNPHGAGIAVKKNGVIYLEKGMMTFAGFNKTLESLNIQKEDDVIYHFRIATHGAVCPALCQPFPISNKDEKLKALSLRPKAILAHNGICQLTEEQGLSDTATLVKYIHELGTEHPLVKSVMDSAGKFVTMDKDEIYLWGKWEEENDLYFSNLHHKARSWRDNIWEDRFDYNKGYTGFGKGELKKEEKEWEGEYGKDHGGLYECHNECMFCAVELNVMNKSQIEERLCIDCEETVGHGGLNDYR